MSLPQTTREALVVEALGEVAVLLDRVEAVGDKMASAADALDRACARLEVQAAAASPRMTQLAEHAHGVAAKHIARSSLELMHSAAEAERRSMAAFARALFHSELNPALQGLRQAAHACATGHHQRRVSRGACAATAAGSALLAAVLTLCIVAL